MTTTEHQRFAAGLVLSLTVLLTACGSSQPASLTSQDATGLAAACQDPYPCGGEWPPELSGPFSLAEVRHVQVSAHDGVTLDGWIALPAVPVNTQMPTIYVSTPYFDSASLPGSAHRDPGADFGVPGGAGGLSGWWSEDGGSGATDLSGGIPPIRWIRRGYAIAYFSVRGTGNSGGCLGVGDADSQLDHETLINWLAAQPWSNGRVGMVGYSYGSYTSWQAATLAPTALKAIVTGGDLIDLYQFIYSPEGARSAGWDAYWSVYSEVLTALSGDISGRTDFVTHTACTDSVTASAQRTDGLITGDRSAQFWEERSYYRRLPMVKAAVLDTGGFFDLGPHQFEDSAVWGALSPETPKVQVRGWWGHGYPPATLDFVSGPTTWENLVASWFDYWLKGVGPAPRIGVVYHQDQNLVWHEGSSWSPDPSKKEVLYLGDGTLDVAPASTSAAFVSAPNPLDLGYTSHLNHVFGLPGLSDETVPKYSLCPAALSPNLSSRYVSAPAAADTLIAGNPFAYLMLSSNEAGGLVTVELYDLAPEFTCHGSLATGARYIASGSADLNFYQTPYASQPFPVAVPTPVRIDLTDVTYSVAANHRLAVVLSHGEVISERADNLTFPILTIYGAGGENTGSHVVIPIAEGTLGGQHPQIEYQQRPFTPPGYLD